VATVNLLLEEWGLLTRRVVTQKQGWVDSAKDEAVRSAAAVTGRLLTPETFDMAPAALAFLLGAKVFSSGSSSTSLRLGDSGPPRGVRYRRRA
jgi:hypothetical protein